MSVPRDHMEQRRDAAPASGGVLAASLAEARRWLDADGASAPDVARRLRERRAAAVCLVGAGNAGDRMLHWLDTPHARGWLAVSGEPAVTGDAGRFGAEWEAALASGFVAADAAVVAAMTLAGAGRTAVAAGPQLLPRLSWSEAPVFAPARPPAPRRLGLYAIVDSAQRLEQVLAAGAKTVQLRIKTPPAPDDAWRAMLRGQVQRSVAACRAVGAELYVNDHWELAAGLGGCGVHLGQEDLAALDEAARAALLASGVALGVSSHSLWELARARTLAPAYLACGPVWPTLTKDMPWRPQGLDNLAWWCAMAGVPVVAIGGILSAEQMTLAARSGASAVCAVRVLGDEPTFTVPLLQQALTMGRAAVPRLPVPALPHPSLASPYGRTRIDGSTD